jgi:hypothetical protein
MQVAEVPGGLAAIAVGAELGAALHTISPAQVPNDRILDVLAAEYRQLCHHQARIAAVLAEVNRSPGSAAPGQVVRSQTPDRFAPDETRAALRWTRHTAEAEHSLAETVVHDMPALFAAWLAGVVDRARVQVFAQYLTGLTPDQIERICRIAVPRAARLTTGQLANLLRRMVIAVDPDAAARWYRKGVRERNVTAYPAPDGTITISANGLPADQAEAACARIQQLAAAAKRAGHPGLIGQIRCDLYLGLLDGRFHGMTIEQVIGALIRDYRPAGPAGPAAPAGPAGPAEESAATPPARRPDTARPTTSGPDDIPPDTGGPDDSGPDDSGPDDSGPDDSGPDTGGSGRIGRGPRPPTPGPTGNPADHRVGIEIRVGLATLLGLDEHPAEIPGLGLLIAPDARHRVALQDRCEWRFAVTDTDGTLISEGHTRHRPTSTHRNDGPRGGIVELHVPATLLHELTADPTVCGGWAEVIADIAAQHANRERHLADLDAHPHARHPHAALRRHTEIRDRTCTFAGICRRPARATDIDHTRDHAHGGTTVRINLGPLCDHDHDVKHRAGWTVTQPEPGTFVWHSPLGGTYLTRGEFLCPELPDPAPTHPDPRPARPPLTVEGPILRRPPPPEPDPPPAPADDDPDEPPF